MGDLVQCNKLGLETGTVYNLNNISFTDNKYHWCPTPSQNSDRCPNRNISVQNAAIMMLLLFPNSFFQLEIIYNYEIRSGKYTRSFYNRQNVKKLLTSFHCLSVIQIVSEGEYPKIVVTELGTGEYL